MEDYCCAKSLQFGIVCYIAVDPQNIALYISLPPPPPLLWCSPPLKVHHKDTSCFRTYNYDMCLVPVVCQSLDCSGWREEGREHCTNKFIPVLRQKPMVGENDYLYATKTQNYQVLNPSAGVTNYRSRSQVHLLHI